MHSPPKNTSLFLLMYCFTFPAAGKLDRGRTVFTAGHTQMPTTVACDTAGPFYLQSHLGKTQVMISEKCLCMYVCVCVDLTSSWLQRTPSPIAVKHEWGHLSTGGKERTVLFFTCPPDPTAAQSSSSNKKGHQDDATLPSVTCRLTLR